LRNEATKSFVFSGVNHHERGMGTRIFVERDFQAKKIFFVGNVMIDSLVRLLPLAKKACTDSVPGALCPGHAASAGERR
jgi:hypothetical protein